MNNLPIISELSTDNSKEIDAGHMIPVDGLVLNGVSMVN